MWSVVLSRPPITKTRLLIAAATASLLSAFYVGVNSRPAGRAAISLEPATHERAAVPAAQAWERPAAGGRARNVSLQPEALKLGRRLGKRFAAKGREATRLEGTLTVKGETRRVVIDRRQEAEGEVVEVSLAGSGGPLTWEAARGVLTAAGAPNADEAALAERIALDAPEQFVLAQLGGAAYQVVARDVREDEGGGDAYAGPLYDVVRVSMPARASGPAPAWRLYHLNTSTGLLDKVVYEEGGERIEAAISGWAAHAGELQPSKIVWSRRGQVFMVLAVGNVAHGPKR